MFGKRRQRVYWVAPVVAWSALTSFAFAQEAARPPRLTYIKVLKGSTPEYEEVKVDETGTTTCDAHKLSEPPSPQAFKLSSATTHRLFQLSARLNNFQGIDLESHKRVADLGQKTFVYEANGRKSQAEFNYSIYRDAQELSDLFERIVTVATHIRTLEYSIKYDHLGLPRELLLIQIDLERKALADPELMVPTLEEIARNPRFLHLAQVRAQNLLQELQQNGN